MGELAFRQHLALGQLKSMCRSSIECAGHGQALPSDAQMNVMTGNMRSPCCCNHRDMFTIKHQPIELHLAHPVVCRANPRARAAGEAGYAEVWAGSPSEGPALPQMLR